MKSLKIYVCMPILAVVVSGCVATPNNETIVLRGMKPELNAAVSLANSQLKRTLKDFDSVKDFSVVQGDLYPISATNLGFNFEQAWMLCVELNAKNSYGGYTGLKAYGFPMRADENGKPFIVSTVNWRTHTNGNCK